MRRAGRAAWPIVSRAAEACTPGRTTADVERDVRAMLGPIGADPVMQDVRNAQGRRFPACCSICVNEEVVLGVPGDRILRVGDVVTIDLALRLEGWCADVSRAIVVAQPSQPGPGEDEPGRLVAAARSTLGAGLRAMGPGVPWSAVASAVHAAAATAGVRLVGVYGGHGIGRDLHEQPEAWLRTGPDGVTRQDFVLRPGMTVTLEPIVMEGRPGDGEPELILLDDGWTMLAGDRCRACCEERTVTITRGGPEVLTA